MRSLPYVTLSLVLLALPGAARADGFGELVVGLALPLGDDDYADVVDSSLKLGVRGGTTPAAGVGFELGLDWTPINDDYGGSVPGFSWDVSWNRFRLLGGARVGVLAGSASQPVQLFARFGAGLDIVHTSWRVSTPFGRDEGRETDVGLALEVGGGVLVSLGQVAIGAQIALPMGFHFDDNDDDPQRVDLDYTSVDLDILFTIATAF
jgi:hypothetical protein